MFAHGWISMFKWVTPDGLFATILASIQCRMEIGTTEDDLLPKSKRCYRVCVTSKFWWFLPYPFSCVPSDGASLKRVIHSRCWNRV